MWIPLSKKLILSGNRSQGVVQRDQAQMDKALADTWSKVFTHKAIPVELGTEYLRGRNLPKVQEDIQPANSEAFCHKGPSLGADLFQMFFTSMILGVSLS